MISKDKILHEQVTSLSLGKAFHLYEQRNEWVNWDGDTNLIHRSRNNIYLSLTQAEQHAETSRTQGTKFIIDELPYILAVSKSGTLAITELFSENPMARAMLQDYPDEHDLTISSLQRAIQNFKWKVAQVFVGHEKIVPIDAMYYKRNSSPGKKQNSLGWSLTIRKINEGSIVKFANEITSKYLS